MEALDKIIQRDLTIIDQVKLSIVFAFVTNAANIKNVKNIYCQFKVFGQCIEFILEHDFNVIKTDSNVESADLLNKADENFGAIIPIHVLEKRNY
jgi:prephenate dehydratase